MDDVAMGNLGYARQDNDFYATPADVTRAVLPFLRKHWASHTMVWEPACGDGAMSEVLKEAFPRVTSTDLVDRGYSDALACTYDFLAEADPISGIIVTNPPFGDLAEKFIRHALELTKTYRGGVAMLLRNEYDCAITRNDLFNASPFARKVVLTWRPRWVADSTGSPRHNYSWFIWDHAWKADPVLSYAQKGKPQ